MHKLVLTVKRKPGLSIEEFKAHYEDVHAPLAWSHMKPYLARYVRNHIARAPGGAEAPFDCIAELWFHDRAAFEACGAWARSEEGQVLARDEELFMDRSSMRPYLVDEIEGVEP